MGASSQWGTGQGAAYEGTKGPGNGRNVFVPLATPHVVAAGSVTQNTGAATVTFPTPLPGGKANYVVMLTAETETAVGVVTKTNNSDGDFASFVINGTGSDVVQWMVVTVGYGLL